MTLSMRIARVILAAVLALFTAACERKTDAPAPPGVAGPTEGEWTPPPVPTHWTADPPVGTDAGPVTAEMLRDPYADRGRWLHYAGDYAGWRHSPLENVTPGSVRGLRLAWAVPTGTTGQFEVSPVVYAGVMYV